MADGPEISFATLLSNGVSQHAVQMLKTSPFWLTARTANETGLRNPALWHMGLPLTFPPADLEPFLSVLWPAAVEHWKTHEGAMVRKKEKSFLSHSHSLSFLRLTVRF